MLDERFAQHDKIPGDKFVNLDANYTIRSWDYVVRASVDSDSGNIVITLPPVAEARGRSYSIVCRSAADAATITVEDNNSDSEAWGGDYVLDTTGDKVLCHSDGLTWHVVSSIA